MNRYSISPRLLSIEMHIQSFTIRFSILLLGLALTMQGCSNRYGGDILPESIHVSEYSFDPGTIQEAIRNGQSDIFYLEWERRVLDTRQPDAFIRPTPIPGRAPVAWGEADFERVVQASIVLLGKEPTTSARLLDLWFRTPCQYAQIGPQLMSFAYFEVRQPETPAALDLYFQRYVVVDTEVGRLNWDESVLDEVPYGEKERVLDRTTLYIPAEVALQVAERAGGAGFRASLGNACSVSGFLRAGHADDEWQVGYAPDGLPSATFEVQVDKETGQGKIISTPTP